MRRFLHWYFATRLEAIVMLSRSAAAGNERADSMKAIPDGHQQLMA